MKSEFLCFYQSFFIVLLSEIVSIYILSMFFAADAAEAPRKDAGVLLLPKDFLDACGELFLVVPAGQDNTQGRTFNVKFLNVLDPLRDTNNLGRSVNKSKFISTLPIMLAKFSFLFILYTASWSALGGAHFGGCL